jgi:hypothetical protein
MKSACSVLENPSFVVFYGRAIKGDLVTGDSEFQEFGEYLGIQEIPVGGHVGMESEMRVILLNAADVFENIEYDIPSQERFAPEPGQSEEF